LKYTTEDRFEATRMMMAYAFGKPVQPLAGAFQERRGNKMYDTNLEYENLADGMTNSSAPRSSLAAVYETGLESLADGRSSSLDGGHACPGFVGTSAGAFLAA
jgi:hypothetical protein